MQKIVLGKYSPENFCFTDNGESLVVAPLNSPRPSWLKEGEWYFLGKDSSMPARYGWVAQGSRSKIEGDSEYRKLLVKQYTDIEGLTDGTPVACGWFERGVINRRKEFEVHKVFFYEDK